jgi:hypothetical protein
MGSEDSGNILALIIVTFLFISIPLLLFFFAAMVYFNVNQIAKFYYTRTLGDGLLALLLAVVNTVLLFTIRYLVRWVRK